MSNPIQLKKLLAELKKTDQERDRLHSAIREAENKEKMPELIKKYAGKCFKFRNSYGVDSKSWYVYYQVNSIKSSDFAIVNSFQTTSHEENKFTINEKMSFSLLETKITETEYQKALKIFTDKINSL